MCILVFKAMKPAKNKSGGNMDEKENNLKPEASGTSTLKVWKRKRKPQRELKWRDRW